jgi:hypothetical protein
MQTAGIMSLLFDTREPKRIFDNQYDAKVKSVEALTMKDISQAAEILTKIGCYVEDSNRTEKVKPTSDLQTPGWSNVLTLIGPEYA